MHSTISPNMHRLHNVFDPDANYTEMVNFEAQANHEAQEKETTIDRDNKLLSFSTPTLDNVLLDFSFRQTTISITAKLHGMFFLAESPWANPGDAEPAPSELTCYRRNLFQITGSVTLPRALRYLLTAQGDQLPIVRCELVVCATESTEGNPVKVISVPWKTPANAGQPAVEDKTEKEKEPPSIPLDPMLSQDIESEYTSVPFSWKRLQFRMATANNGRRRELQQHFNVRLKVIATLVNGSRCCICEVHSGAVIVRGRSPRNFQSRKDTPLNGAATHARKSAASVSHAQQRNGSFDSVSRPNHGPGTNGPGSIAATSIKNEMAQVHQNGPSLFDNIPGAQDFYDGMMSASVHQGAMTAIPQEPFNFDQHRGYAGSSPDFGRSATPMATSTAPINLSLMDDLPPKKERRSRDPSTPAKRPTMPPPRRPSFGINTVSSPDESADLLYEYFPLALEEWMPPVDAVYRPHVVHHIKISADPRDPNTGAIKGRSKRYFSEVAG